MTLPSLLEVWLVMLLQLIADDLLPSEPLVVALEPPFDGSV
jgi:hypothetical protein